MNQEEKAALERFVVDNQALEALEAKLAQFNIFEAVGMVRQEIRRSNFLAFLLNPSGTHHLNDVFLKWEDLPVIKAAIVQKFAVSN